MTWKHESQEWVDCLDFLVWRMENAMKYQSLWNHTGGGYQVPRLITYKNPDGSTGKAPVDSTMTGQVPVGTVGVILEDTFYPSHNATDFYHHYKEDIALMGEMGFRRFRMSVSWSRICPDGRYQVNEEGLAFYDAVFEELHKYGIEPVVTINHFDMPMYLADHYDGWSSREVIDFFLFYAKTVFTRYKDKVKYWMTFNEINVLSGWCQMGVHDNSPRNLYQARHHIFVASAKAVQMGHEINPENKIGMMVAYTPSYPMTCRPEDVLEAMKFNRQKSFYMDVQCKGYYPEYKLKEILYREGRAAILWLLFRGMKGKGRGTIKKNCIGCLFVIKWNCIGR